MILSRCAATVAIAAAPLVAMRGVLAAITIATLLMGALPDRVRAQSCGGMQDLGTLGGPNAWANGVSADGSVVVGLATNAARQGRAFRWTAAGGMQDLGSLPGGIASAEALGVSADGSVVVGRAFNAASQGRAFRWTAAGGMQDLGSLGGSDAVANGVSGDGNVVVGASYNAQRLWRAFRWTAAGGMQDLGTLGGTQAFAYGASADGSVVVGFSFNPARQARAFRWTAAGGMQDLGLLGGSDAEAYGVSEDGSVVVGYSRNLLDQVRAFRWTEAGGMQDLGTLGSTPVAARGVSAADGSVVVGSARNAAGLFRAFRWTAAGGMQDLGSMGEGNMAVARDVSADGVVVVGDAANAGNQATRAFRWVALLKRIDPLDSINEAASSTARYALNRPADNPEQRTILRRGNKPSPGIGTADVEIALSACFNPSTESVSLEAVHTFNGSPITIPMPLLQPSVPAGVWGCQLREPIGPPVNGARTAKLRVFIPAIAAIGQYTFRAVVTSSTGARLDEMNFPHPVVLLFNPTDPQDEAFVALTSQRTEYVFNDRGAMWAGTARSNLARNWDYAQFTNDAFLASLELLNGLSESQRSSPATVARWLTEKLDANDGGVLVGNWSSSFAGGTEPWIWSSSQSIFARYRASGPVRFGQCWVYAGLLTSSLRTLGIAARPLTNFESGHDKNSNGQLEICYFFDSASGQWRSSGDSIWNFHVWCEAWMRRPDLTGGDGWQVVDATPQERSQGLFQLGPTPVSAIRAGTPQPFDGAFVLSEVNANIINQEQRAGVCTPIGPPNTTWIGRKLTTKAVGSQTAFDITASYKVPETTPDPRDFAEVAVLTSDASPLGAPLHADVTVRNMDAEVRDFTVYVLVRARAQNGNELGVILGPQTDPVTIQPGGGTTIPVDVPWASIVPWIGATEFVEFDIVVTRVADERRWFVQRTVVIRGLPITVSLAPVNQVQLGGQVAATVAVFNPLASPINGASLTVTGGDGLLINGSDRSESIALGPIPPGSSIFVSRTLTASVPGQQIVSAQVFAPGLVPGDVSGTVLVIDCPADFDADGTLTTPDVFAFLNAWFLSDPAANFDGINDVDIQDIFAFLNAWFAGC